MARTFDDATKAQVAELLEKYPTKMAALLPVLWIAQERFGWIDDDAMQLVADTLELPVSHVYGVVTFYTMYYRRPMGRYHVQVCTNIACMLRDAYDVLSRFKTSLGISTGETTPDKMFSLDEVECLAACGTAPCVQINDKYYEPVRPEDVDELIAELRADAEPDAASGSVESPASTPASAE